MTRPAGRNNKRLNLELSEQTSQLLEKLVVATNSDSKAETIRRALALYDHITTETQAGAKLLVVDKDGKTQHALRII